MVLPKVLAVLAWATTTTATSILLPLYIYPLSGAWTPIFNAIASTPTVHWQVVVNPNSGPGPANAYPSSDYITAINQLNSYKNVETIGYVRTNYTNRPCSEVTADIQTYAYWATYQVTNANISVNGIFFDEAPYANLAALIQYMSNVSSFAYDTIPTPATTVIFNPGTSATALQYFNYAQTIIEFEDFYTAYQNQTTINSFPSGGVRKQSAVVVHNYTGTAATLQSLVHTGIVNKLAGMYFTSDCCYQDLSIIGQVATAFSKG
ncbi:Spherulation-specific family 4 [Lasallia pustulata]|uniref:Spherulation-specific family 4 n=1 Tax=Lasallia pustulata TaxID=136370 RepID=A0A1W5DBE1_9LECA|nr:Spherulation-specific family 4 [Lasallia pustulata]